ncbi:MAG: VOC family protein [Dehalococcoidia bacterium]
MGDMGVGQIHHTGLTVSDLERSVAFYRDMLGCSETMRQERAGGYLAAIVGYPDAHVKMAHLRAPTGTHVVELFEYVQPQGTAPHIEPATVGTAHICFLVEDLATVYDRLREAGVTDFVSPPVEVDSGVNRGGLGLYLRDPDGLLIELFQPASGG